MIVGDIVRHKIRPEWGLGTILDVRLASCGLDDIYEVIALWPAMAEPVCTLRLGTSAIGVLELMSPSPIAPPAIE
jgi:hypothetical protein